MSLLATLVCQMVLLAAADKLFNFNLKKCSHKLKVII
jgi:hypothetical protein